MTKLRSEKNNLNKGWYKLKNRSGERNFDENVNLSGKANIAIGATDGGAAATNNKPVMVDYDITIDFNASFTGDDALDISFIAGNANTETGPYLFDLESTSDDVQIDSISYTFPIGDNLNILISDSIRGDSLFTTSSEYDGLSEILDENGLIQIGNHMDNNSPVISMDYNFNDKFNGAFSYVADSDRTKGFMTDESDDLFALNGSYTSENWGLSLTYAHESQADSNENSDLYLGLNFYYDSEGGIPKISAGVEIGGQDSNNKDTNAYFLGVTWDEVGPGSLNLGLGTHTATEDDTDDQLIYEASYSYQIKDSVNIDALIYSKENDTAGQDNETGFLVKTSFNF